MRFSHARKGKRPLSKKNLDKGRFPFLAWENRISQGAENGSSLISVPLALREAKINKKSQDFGFSLDWITKARAKENLREFIIYFVSVSCCCGLRVPNIIITKANAKENLGEFACLSITKANAKTNLQILFVITFVWMVVGVLFSPSFWQKGQDTRAFSSCLTCLKQAD